MASCADREPIRKEQLRMTMHHRVIVKGRKKEKSRGNESTGQTVEHERGKGDREVNGASSLRIPTVFVSSQLAIN